MVSKNPINDVRALSNKVARSKLAQKEKEKKNSYQEKQHASDVLTEHKKQFDEKIKKEKGRSNVRLFDPVILSLSLVFIVLLSLLILLNYLNRKAELEGVVIKPTELVSEDDSDSVLCSTRIAAIQKKLSKPEFDLSSLEWAPNLDPEVKYYSEKLLEKLKADIAGMEVIEIIREAERKNYLRVICGNPSSSHSVSFRIKYLEKPNGKKKAVLLAVE